MISEKKQAPEQSDSDFIAEILARTADSLNTVEHAAVAVHLKTIFRAVKNQATAVFELEAESKTLASRIAALEAENAALADARQRPPALESAKPA